MSSFDGEWVIVPANLTLSGKPERRFRMASGKYRETQPNTPEFYDQVYGQPARNVLGGIRDFFGGLSVGMDALNSSVTGQPIKVSAEADRGPTPPRVPPDPKYKQQELDAGMAAEDWRPGAGFPGQQVIVIENNEPDAQASEMERMRQQYGAGASFWNTDEGKDLLLDTMSNQYTGDQAGLPGFYQDQVKAGLGQMEMIKKGLGYEEGSAMAKWADANPALALREYNKRQPNAYSGTGPSDEEIKAAIAKGVNTQDGGYFAAEGSPNPLPETGTATKSNNAQTADLQNAMAQAQAYGESGVPGLQGKSMLSKNMMNLLRRQGRI